MENRSEQTPGKGFADIGREILFAARNELYLNLPYLDVALCALAFQPGGEVTLSLATDGRRSTTTGPGSRTGISVPGC